MAVPDSVRRVVRPLNTVVVDTGNDGPKRYAVRERSFVKYIAGKNPQPHNGKTIGYISDGVFVPRVAKTAKQGAECLSYGASALVYSLTRDLYSDLLNIYPIEDAVRLMVLSTLKVLKPHLPNSRMRAEYERTFVSVFYPGAKISENTITKFLNAVGMDGQKRRAFYRMRILSMTADHHIAIDGSLIQDTSIVNDLSAFSRKARVKGCKDISLLYAYDIEKGEPICADLFPGNSIDATSYREFITRNEIDRGIIVADKGFPPKEIYDVLKSKPQLHYLTPLKRNDKRIEQFKMHRHEGVLEGYGKPVSYKKCALPNGRFLYAFQDTKKAGIEHTTYVTNAAKKGTFDQADYEQRKSSFGTIVFESDQDLPAKTIYMCYEDRWKLELVFRHYKNDTGFDTTNVQGDFAVMGETFVNLLSSIATCRILERLRQTNLLKEMTYGDLMDDLSSAWRNVNASENPQRDDGGWIHTLKCVHEELEALGLSKPPVEYDLTREKKKPGPKPKKPVFVGPKRPRGRPRKNV